MAVCIWNIELIMLEHTRIGDDRLLSHRECADFYTALISERSGGQQNVAWRQKLFYKTTGHPSALRSFAYRNYGQANGV